MKTTKIKANLVGLAELRESFGLTQKLMAMYLKINVNTLKVVETGRRSLPTYALIRIAHLEVKLAGKNGDAGFNNLHPLDNTYSETFKEKYQLLAARVNKCRAGKILLANELDTMKCNNQKLRARLQMIEMIIAQNNGVETELQEWQKEKDIVAHLLGKCSVPLQLLTQTRLQIMESEINLYDKLHRQLKTDSPEF